MDKDLYEKYKEVQLPIEVVQMFSDIIVKDEATRKVLIHIAKHTTDEEEMGITIGQLVDRVKLKRKVQKGKTFVVENTNINRKHAERIVNSLSMMGLCYFRTLPPTRVINFTIRGKQVAAEIRKRLKEKGEGFNVQ